LGVGIGGKLDWGGIRLLKGGVGRFPPKILARIKRVPGIIQLGTISGY